MERERERERDRQTDRQKQTQRETETDRDTEREAGRQAETGNKQAHNKPKKISGCERRMATVLKKNGTHEPVIVVTSTLWQQHSSVDFQT